MVLSRAGFALLPCSLMLVVVLLALSASLRSMRLQQDATLANEDLRIARHAAESALADAEHDLRVAFQRGPANENPMPPAERFTSLCSGSHDPASRYQMALLWSDGRQAICQLTAHGRGRIASTPTHLQAEFRLRDCPPPDPSLTDDRSEASCHKEIQLLSWRTLEEV
jgi:Tfp pilus assembly protein PilX